MKLRRYKKKSIGSYLSYEIVIIILSIIFSLIIINYFGKKYNDIFLSIAEARVRKYLTVIINDSTSNIKFDKDLLVIDKDNNNEIKLIKYDSYVATSLMNNITDNIQDKLAGNNINESIFLIADIPFGVVFKNSLMRNIGPRIKVRMELLGDVISELETEVKPYGINNALVEVRVNIKANAKIILPLVTKDITVSNVIPISINIINGKIPEAYFSTYK